MVMILSVPENVLINAYPCAELVVGCIHPGSLFACHQTNMRKQLGNLQIEPDDLPMTPLTPLVMKEGVMGHPFVPLWNGK
jgi:hypothetical protein